MLPCCSPDWKLLAVSIFLDSMLVELDLSAGYPRTFHAASAANVPLATVPIRGKSVCTDSTRHALECGVGICDARAK